MDAKTLEALQASIEKWERNAVAERSSEYATHWTQCPLCLLFNHDVVPNDQRCRKCPVYERTGQRFCEDSPYEDAVTARNNWRYGEGTKIAAHEATRAEVVFLESLLPAPLSRASAQADEGR
jgi:hypothetical protein